jgi:predicted transcriptional regulator
MRITIELPNQLLERVKIIATKQQTTMRKLIIQGLETILDTELSPDTLHAFAKDDLLSEK